MKLKKSIIFLLVFIFFGILPSSSKEVSIGSKAFTESYVLGDIALLKLQSKGLKATHKKGLGGTSILWTALQNGVIDCYPEYTGTIQEVILKSTKPLKLSEMKVLLKEQGIGITEPLGFNNTFAFAMRGDVAHSLSITKISDLKKHPNLKLAFSHEFIGRNDGWKALSNHYGLQMSNVKSIEHNLGYDELSRGSVDLINAYSTDPKLAHYNFVVLKDDLDFFPVYEAVFVYNLKTPSIAIYALKELEETIDQRLVLQLNAKAEKSKNYMSAAKLYFHDTKTKQENGLGQILKWTSQHIFIVIISMFFAVLFGIPLGIQASHKGFLSSIILGVCGVVQTIPSLSLLALFVPLFGISTKTAIIVLFLYSLLPIVKGTSVGLQSIPSSLYESAEALGLSAKTKLLKVFLPLALRSILAGIKTSAIVNIGTASLAALIGAGGLGEPIISGLNLNDNQLILQGAIPAAILALLTQVAFEVAEKVFLPKGLINRN